VLGSLFRSRSGAMALTVSQMFLGAVSLGIGLLRGTDIYVSFYSESLVGHSNYGASKLAHDHGRSANVVVNNNVVMTAIMGPRFAVEADNITMDVNAAVACAQCPAGPKCYLCAQYAANKPRALVKLAWVRAKQLVVWGSLGKLSGELDKLAAIQAADLVARDVGRVDRQVKVRFDDPGRERPIWGGRTTAISCRLSVKDVLPSPMLGHAFPILMTENMFPSMPQILVKAMPRLVCGIGDGAGGLSLPDIPEIADRTRDECRDLEVQMTCSVSASMGRACASTASEEILNLGNADGRVGFAGDVQPFVSCQAGSPSSPIRLRGSGYSYRSGGSLVTCSFDRDRCSERRLTENTDRYLREQLGLPRVITTNLVASLGGDEPRKPSSGTGSPRDFCACTYSQRPVDGTVIGITDALRKIASFGQAGPSEALRREREYRSCGKWYFPEKSGPYASVSADEQPFVGAWKWALVNECSGGRS
jgi:hypothetical protein